MAQQQLTSVAHISVGDPVKLYQAMLAGYTEYYPVEMRSDGVSISLAKGCAHMQLIGDELRVSVEAANPADLAYLKYTLAEGVLWYAQNAGASDTPEFVWHGDGVSGGLPPFFREMRVVTVDELSPMMRRVRLSGDDLQRFAQGGLHVRLLLPPQNCKPPLQPKWPELGQDGRPVWPEGDERLINRVYTIRKIDVTGGWVEIDMVAHHSDGDASGAVPDAVNAVVNGEVNAAEGDMHPDPARSPGAYWVNKAKPGDLVGMTGPGGGDIPEADVYILIGDETALPAISRIVEHLPSQAQAFVRVEVAGVEEQQILTSKAKLDLVWLHRNGAVAGTTDILPEAVRQLGTLNLPDQTNNKKHFYWAGCEYTAFRAIRSFWRKDCGLTRDQHLAVAYWRRGISLE